MCKPKTIKTASRVHKRFIACLMMGKDDYSLQRLACFINISCDWNIWQTSAFYFKSPKLRKRANNLNFQTRRKMILACVASQQHLSRLIVMFEHVIKWVPPTLAYASLKDSFLARLTIYLPFALHAEWQTWEPQSALTIFSRWEQGLIGLEYWFPVYFNRNDQRTEGKHLESGAGV